MKIAITGATGSIGTALLRRLLADGEHELVALARRTPVKGRDTQEHGWERVHWTSVDLTRDAVSMSRLRCCGSRSPALGLPRLQPLDPGWLDLGMNVPLMDTTRVREVLGWAPSHTADAVLTETVAALRDSAAGSTPALRPRSVAGQLRDRIRRGPIASRPRP